MHFQIYFVFCVKTPKFTMSKNSNDSVSDLIKHLDHC